MKNVVKLLKNSGIFLIAYMAMILIVTSVLFLFHIPINKFNMLISLLLTLLLFYIGKDKLKISKKDLLKCFGVSLIVIVISTLFMGLIYDRSSDGNTYHKDAIGNLYLGWNPTYESSTDFVNENIELNNYDLHSYDIWKDHYAKANWILEANFYKLTDNIESGKAVNLIFMYILFVYSLSFFYKKLGNKAFILASVITFNPVCCNQLFTFYNDQLGSSLLFILIIALLSINSKKQENNIVNFIVLSATFIIITNIKFNIMGYGLIFTFIFMLRYLFINYKKKKLGNCLLKMVPLYVSLFAISFGLVGYSTYIKNYIDHGNMFFPVYGDNGEDIITAQQPSKFTSMNSIEKFFIGTFSHTNNLQESKEYSLKIPFTFSISEIKESMSVDTRIGGFGILFSGLFVVSLIAILIYFKKAKLNEEKIDIIILLSVTLFLILVISESWWARYNPGNYIFVVILAYFILKYSKFKYINYLFLSLIFINCGLILLGNGYYSLKESISTKKHLNSMNNVLISFNTADATGILYNLNDNNITYEFVDNKDLDNVTYFKYLNYKEVNDEEE